MDEDAVVAGLDPDATPGDDHALAAAKADAVAHSLDPAVAANCIVIGCDSMLYRDGELVGKPSSEAAARESWRQMGGKSVSSTLALRNSVARQHDYPTRRRRHLYHRPLWRPVACRSGGYIERGEPLAVAGGFTLDGLGGWFVDGVDGDPSSVIGISLPLTRRLLEGARL